MHRAGPVDSARDRREGVVAGCVYLPNRGFTLSGEFGFLIYLVWSRHNNEQACDSERWSLSSVSNKALQAMSS